MAENNKKKRKLNKKAIIIIAIVLVVYIGGSIAIGKVIGNVGAEMEKTMKDLQEDGTYKVTKVDVKQEITTSATVIGLDKNAYTSPVTAKVEKVCVEPGQFVKKGDILLTYDASELGDNLDMVRLQAQSEQAAGNESYEAAREAAKKVKVAKRKIESIKKEIKSIKKEMETLSKNPVENATKIEEKKNALLKKQEQLAKQQTIVETNKDVKVSDSAASQIRVTKQMSNMNVDNAKKDVVAAKAGITAIADGIVESVDIIKGAYANETQTLMTIINARKIGVEFTISKDDLAAVTEGQKARVVIGNKEYAGKVDYVSRVATTDVGVLGNESAAGGSIKGRIVLENPDDEIFVGVTAKAYIFIGESKGALAIPYSALCTDVEGNYVYVVNDKNIIERKDVTLGLCSGEYYEVLEGISEGDKVITEVTKTMKPGEEYVAPAVNGMPIQ